jgi:hypothetical protein
MWNFEWHNLENVKQIISWMYENKKKIKKQQQQQKHLNTKRTL